MKFIKWVIFGSMDEALVGQWVIRVINHDLLAMLIAMFHKSYKLFQLCPILLEYVYCGEVSKG